MSIYSLARGWAGGLATWLIWKPGRTAAALAIAGVIMTQILPFADPQVLTLYRAFEGSVYAAAIQP
jgi:hypothetical protein